MQRSSFIGGSRRVQDLRVGVSSLTFARYGGRLASLGAWLSQHGLGVLEDLQCVPLPVADKVLTAYILGLFLANRPFSHGSYALAGFQLWRPDARGHLKGSWRALRQWHLREPTEMRVPVLPVVVKAVALVFLTSGFTSTAVAVLLAFQALLRPGEMCSLQRRHLVLPCDGLEPGHIVLALASTKTANRGAKVQSVLLRDWVLSGLCELAFGDLPAQAVLVPGGEGQLRQRFRWALSRLHIPVTAYSLGGLRAGGATWHFSRYQNLAALKFLGRWDNERTLAHYVQGATAAIAYTQLPHCAVQRCRTLSRAADTILPAIVSCPELMDSVATQSL